MKYILKISGVIACIGGLYVSVPALSQSLDVWNKSPESRFLESAIAICLFVFICSGIYLIFTKKSVSNVKSSLLLVLTIINVVLPFIPARTGDVISLSVILSPIALFVYVVTYLIVIITSKKPQMD